MFCPNCGNTLPDGSQFCGQCGTQLGVSQQAAAAPAAGAYGAAAPAAGAYGSTSPYGAAVAKKGNKNLIIGIAAVALVAIIVGILFGTGVIGGKGGGVSRAYGINAQQVIASDSKTASAAVEKLVELDFDELDDVDFIELYASSQDMADFIENLYEDAMDGEFSDAESIDDILSADQAKQLAGDWVIATLDNEELPGMAQDYAYYQSPMSRDEIEDLIDFDGTSALMMTIVDSSEVSGETLAGIVEAAGVNFDHVYAQVETAKGVLNAFSALGADGLDELEDAIDELDEVGFTGAGLSYFWGDQIGIAAVVQTPDYAVVALYVANCEDFGIDPSMFDGIYMK